MTSTALCESLPYWEFESAPQAHMVLWDGSLASGVELLPQDIECFDADRINHLTLNLRTFINSLPEKITAQFFMKVETEFGDLIKDHEELVKSENSFLQQLDKDRIGSLNEQIQGEEVFRPRLFLFLKSESPEKPSSLSLKKTQKFSMTYGNDFMSALQGLSQALESSRSVLGAAGFVSMDLSREEMTSLIYKYLNPMRSKESEVPAITARPESLENESPRSQLVFGDLVLDQEDFILDRTLTRVVTLKTLPELTYAGMMSLFLSMKFKYELILF